MKLISKDLGFIYENSELINCNSSGIVTILIKEAAKCSAYSSDLLIDIIPLLSVIRSGTKTEFVDLCDSDSNENETPSVDKSSRYVRYLGFRDMGVDHLNFITSRIYMSHKDENPYRVIYRLSAEVFENNTFTLSLDEVTANEIKDKFVKSPQD